MLWLYLAFYIILLQLIFGALAIHFRTGKFVQAAYASTFLLLICRLYFFHSSHILIHTFLFLLVFIRALRLTIYLFFRAVAIGEDKRFAVFKQQPKAFAKFRLLQAVVIFILLLPISLVMQQSVIPLTRYTWLGLIVCIAGIGIETRADRQKFTFKRQYPTKWCNIGLRSKARYPNYFGEMLMRAGIYLIALAGLSEGEMLLALLSPFTIGGLLLFFTGIPVLEREHEAKRGDDPERKAYVETTNLLLPR